MDGRGNIGRCSMGHSGASKYYNRMQGRLEISWSTYGPLMVYLPFLKLTERVFGSHPYRIVSVSYGRASPFHGERGLGRWAS